MMQRDTRMSAYTYAQLQEIIANAANATEYAAIYAELAELAAAEIERQESAIKANVGNDKRQKEG